MDPVSSLEYGNGILQITIRTLPDRNSRIASFALGLFAALLFSLFVVILNATLKDRASKLPDPNRESTDHTRQRARDNLGSLGERLSEQIIAQDSAIEEVTGSVQRSLMGLGKKGKPAIVALLIGTTGVGKTELVRCLSTELFGSLGNNLLRLDMSEYKHSSDVTKLIGAGPGWAGHDKGGLLTKWLAAHPRSIVLIDEIEKADKQVIDIFLQIFDNSRVTGGDGKTVECPETMFFMTSNIGSTYMISYPQIEHRETVKQLIIEHSLPNHFSPEFLGRVQQIAFFYPLSVVAVRRIVVKHIEEIKNRFIDNPHVPRPIDISYDEVFIHYVANQIYDPKSGIRGLENAFDRLMTNPLANAMLGLIRETDSQETIQFHFTVVSGKVLMSRGSPPSSSASHNSPSSSGPASSGSAAVSSGSPSTSGRASSGSAAVSSDSPSSSGPPGEFLELNLDLSI